MATLKDIALKADVSQGTVSRVLSGDVTLKISDNTREKIFKVANELGYRRKAKNIRQSGSAVGIVMWHSHAEEIEDNYYQGLRKSVESKLISSGFKPDLIYRDDSGAVDFHKDSMEGIIAIGKFSHKELGKFKKYSPNVILLDSTTSYEGVDSVSVDLREITRQSLNLIWKKGIHDIGFICGREKIGKEKKIYIDPREEEYKRFMAEKSINEDKLKYRIGTFGLESGCNMMNDMINDYKDKLPKAFFIASDYLALGAIKALNENGLKVPKDVSIISVDNLPFTEFTEPSITSVEIDSNSLGEAAVDLLMERRKGRKFTKRVYINHTFKFRESFKEE